MQRATAFPVAFLSVAAWGAFSPSAEADTVHLRNGGKLTAVSWRIEGPKLAVETMAGTITIDRAEVLRIDRDTAPGSAQRRSPANEAAQPGEAQGPSLTGAFGLSTPSEEARLTGLGHLAYRRGDYDTALSLYRQALALDSGFTPAGVSAAAAALALGDASGAAERARQALAHDPSSAEGWWMLGRAEYQQGRLAEAQAAWKRSVALDPSQEVKDLLERISRERAAASGFRAVSSAHFRLEYDGEVLPRLGQESLPFLEEAFDGMVRAFRHSPGGSITVIFYPRESFHELTGMGGSVAGLFDGKVRIPQGGPDRLTEEVRRVLRHELAHAFIASKTAGNCPRWLHEGLAQHLEPRTARGRERQILRSLGDGPVSPDVSLSYAEALSLVEYMEGRWGDIGVLTLLERLGEGVEWEEACRAVLSTSTADLVAEWQSDLRSHARAEAARGGDAGESPLESR